MRITTFLLLVCVFCSMAENSHSQNARVSISKSNTLLDDILNEIEHQTDYLFIYNNQVNVNRKASVKAKSLPVSQVLDKLFAGTEIQYTMEGTHIVLSTKEVTEGTAVQQQKQKITGTIVDSNGDPVAGANVIVKGTTNGTITDMDGNFAMDADAKSVLNISYIGYLTKEMPVGNQKTIRVVLVEDTKALDEVVVIGYGTQKKADLTGSVANISTEKLSTQSNANIGQALQGKIAGVDIVSQGGTPGAGSRIMVRGIGTLNNSNPLYIVDGIYMGDIDHINPNDIASIDVLKDASSSAIYGSRAANGVIIVTTKQGSNTEGKPIVNISANIGVQTPTKYLDLLNAEEWSRVTTVSREAIGAKPMEMATNLSDKPDNDWQRVMMSPALMQNYNASIKGGGKSYTYYTGLGYFNQDGTVKGTNYERFTVQFKSDYKKGWFSAGNNIVVTNNNDAPLPGYSRGGLLGVILQTIPTLEKYDDSRLGGYGGVYGDATDLPNPLGWMDDNITKRTNDNMKAYINLYAQIEFLTGLKYKLNVTPDFQYKRNLDYQARFDFGLTTNSITQMTEERNNYNNLLVENLLTFDRTFGDHKISVLAGYTYQNNKYRYLVAKGKGMPDGLIEIDAATTDRTNGGYSTRSAMTSILARAFYSYKNRYLITATLRRDGSSKFAADNRYGNFPSVSIGWNMAEESFMESAHWLDQLKLRGGYGVLGNQEIDNYLYTSVITTGINYPDGKGGLLQGAFPKDFSTPNIKWEETAMTNFGLDFVALNNRLSLTMDYYVKNTKDILLSVPIPISSGGANDPLRNAGEIRNKGFEFNVGWSDRPNKDILYGVNFIGSFMKNEVTKMGTGSQAIWSGATNLNVNACKTMAGYPIGGYWLIPTDGYFQNAAEVSGYVKDGGLIQPNAAPGDIRFRDVNNDGKINDDDRVYKGSPFPKFTMSVNGNLTIKNVDAMIGLQGVFGNKIYNATRQTLEGVNKGTNFMRTTLDYWTAENPNAAHPRLIWDDPNRNNRPESDRYLESGSFFRIRNIQVGYTLPKNWFNGFLQHTRIYANIENPVMFTGYKGYSPDINTSDSKSRGFDNFTYPMNRVFMFGLNVTF